MLAGLFGLPLALPAQTYSVDWYKIAGGGGLLSGTNYSLTGTIGQPDASSVLSGGNYSVTGGFWSLVQTPGAPPLYISHSGNAVTVSWQNVAGWNLVQSGNLATPLGSWPASGGVTTSNGTNYLNLGRATGVLFFRLKQ